MPVRRRHLPTSRRAERGDVVQQAILSVGRQECQQALGEPGTGLVGVKARLAQRGRPVTSEVDGNHARSAEVAWNLHRGQPGGGRDHRRRGEPPAHRRTADARSGGAAEVDHEGGVASAANCLGGQPGVRRGGAHRETRRMLSDGVCGGLSKIQRTGVHLRRPAVATTIAAPVYGPAPGEKKPRSIWPMLLTPELNAAVR
ncbi:isocitrate lyase AceAb [Mycobacterium tuberculosis TKK-01-0023]|nr:isocitrate lyase AceAb [Mycobacterium tuberculosis TKK-01-0023]KBY69799.1 isocitrate lyase AceAb [Mycobacterium tuberculosis TKK-01-0024]